MILHRGYRGYGLTATAVTGAGRVAPSGASFTQSVQPMASTTGDLAVKTAAAGTGTAVVKTSQSATSDDLAAAFEWFGFPLRKFAGQEISVAALNAAVEKIGTGLGMEPWPDFAKKFAAFGPPIQAAAEAVQAAQADLEAAHAEVLSIGNQSAESGNSQEYTEAVAVRDQLVRVRDQALAALKRAQDAQQAYGNKLVNAQNAVIDLVLARSPRVKALFDHEASIVKAQEAAEQASMQQEIDGHAAYDQQLLAVAQHKRKTMITVGAVGAGALVLTTAFVLFSRRSAS